MSDVFHRPLNVIVLSYLAMAKVRRKNETNKEKRKKVTQNSKNRRYFSDFITEKALSGQNFVILQA